MTNYVIINGTNSKTITGLAINELPPITKPLMRTEKEEIDGRDGDIITKLGYSAYDKTITIGLWGTGYDVNSIISFFNKEGTITFSNEADKYYNFTMLEQFDIESLLRFKTATITFHCQPFKYPLTETPIEIQYEYIEQDNVESASLNNTNGDKHLSIDLKGNTSQTGTPTPSTPIPINVVSGDNTITIANSDNTQSQTYPIYLGVENLSSVSKIIGVRWANDNTDLKNILNNLQAGTYTISSKITITQINSTTTLAYGIGLSNSNYQATQFYRTTYSNPSVGTTFNFSATFTINSADVGNFTHFYLYTGDSVIGTWDEIQIEKGTKANHYTEYGTTPIELCKIGDYQDYFYKDSGKWYLHKEIGKETFVGTENWEDRPNYTDVDRFILGNRDWNTTAKTLLSNYFVNVNTTTSHDYPNIASNGSQCMINFTLKGTTTLSQFKEWLSTHNTIVYYVLATATNTEITDTTLITQLDNIQNAMSYEGQTNVSQVNNDKPFIMDLIAMKDGTDEVVVNNIGNTYSKPTIALEGTGDINIYLNGTQMLKATLTDKMTIDTNNLEAYNPDTMTLLNRQLVGDISKFTLASGNNSIKVDGNLTKATITNYTRWL